MGWILLIAMVLAVAVFSQSPTTAPTTKMEPTAEQKAAKDEKDAAEQRRFAADVSAVKTLQTSMKNPDSFKLEQALRMKDGALCLTYRAKNSFNATIPGRAVISKSSIITSDHGNFSASWNAMCAGKSGDDVTYIRITLGLL